MEKKQLELHAIVRGKVQGVGFRATTRDLALQLGLTGTVRNLSDGTVEIYAHGTQEALDTFLKKLQAHFESYIRSIETHYSKLNHPFSKFAIVV